MLLSALLCLLPQSGAALPVARAGEPSARVVAAHLLDLAAERSADELEQAHLGRMRRAVERAGEVLGEDGAASVLEELLWRTRWAAATDPARARRALARSLEIVADDLRHEPLIEASLPEGFPGPTPVHHVELKQYPTYRMASAPAGGGENRAFWTLFRHIQSNDVAMTAPVEMTWDAGASRLAEERMAFLYGSPDLGASGVQGRVDVRDVEPQLVLSLGCRGRMTAERVERGLERLQAWLADHPELEVAGPVRSMGYNSPMVPAARCTYEVQLPVRRRAPEPSPLRRSLGPV